MATLTVDTLNDDLYDGGDLAAETLDDGGLSLREALALASGGDEIVFDASLIVGPNDGHLILTNGELMVATGVTINGDIGSDGSADITVDANGAANTRVFNVGNVTATFEGLVITGGNADYGAGIVTDGGTVLTVRNSTITDNHIGGGIRNVGTLFLDGVTVSGNSSITDGGGIANANTLSVGVLHIVNSTIANNSAAFNGGGLVTNGGTTTSLTNVTMFGNSASGSYGGGAAFSSGDLTLTQVTITGNHADVEGGGLLLSAGTTTITNSIIAGNDAAGSPSEVGGTAPPTYTGVNVVGVGADTDASDGVINTPTLGDLFDSVAPVDLDGGDPDTPFDAGVLANNGGTILTVAIKTGGVAHDTGTTAAALYDDDGNSGTPDVGIPTDARGLARFAGTNVDIGAFEVAGPATFTVTTLSDDGFDGGTLADELLDGGGLSLREALALADADTATHDIINFDLALTGGFVDGVDNGHLYVDNGELIIASDVTINGDVDGDGRADIILDADLNSRVIHATGGVATLNALTITGGSISAGNGGGILVDQTAALTINNSTVAGNHGDGSGGGITNEGLLTLNNTLIAANTAQVGGGVANAATGTAFLTNTTIYGNSADIAVGGMSNNGTATLTNVTVTGNAADVDVGGIGNTGTVTLTNSIVAGNDAPTNPDYSDFGGGTTAFNGHNLFSQAGVGDAGDTAGADIADIFRDTGTSPFSGAEGGLLDDNGGPTPTVAIKTGGLAHNAPGTVLPGDVTDANGNGNTGEPLPIDARDFSRDVDGVDIGAVELQQGVTYLVTTLDDEEYDGGDFAAETADGHLSLREALGLANGDPTSADTIRFDAGLVDGTLTLQHGALVVIGDVEITGDVPAGGDRDITIDAGGSSRVFMIDSGTVTLNGLIMTNGEATCGCDPGYGGAVSIGSYLYGGVAHVTISNSTVSNSSAYYGGGISVDTYSSLRMLYSTVTGNSADIGGGIAVNLGATLTTVHTTISNNEASGSYGYGGGVSIYGGTATLVNTTLSGNSAYLGGGIYNSGDLTLVNATIANNTAYTGGGLYTTACGCSNTDIFNSTFTGNFATDNGGGIAHLAGTLNITNSIVAGNGAGVEDPDLVPAGTVNYAGRNVFSQDGVGGPGDIFEPDVNNIFTNVVLVDPTPDDGDEFFAGELADGNGLVQVVAIKATGVAWNAGDAGELPPDSEDLNGNTNTTEDLPVDARGLQRIYGAGLDIGAFELIGSPPTEVFNNPLAVNEGGSATLSTGNLWFTDVEEPNDITYTLTSVPTGGTLFRNGVEMGLGSTFSQNDIDNSRIDFVHDGSEAPTVTFEFSVDDGPGGNVVTGQTFTFTVNQVNDAPTLGLPGTQEIEANTPTAIAGISVFDDALSGSLTTTLSVTHGTLTITPSGSLAVGGNGTATVVLTGTLADLTDTLAAANGVVYRGAHDFFGSDTLTVSTNDNGNTGTGGPLSATDSFDIHLNTLIAGTGGDDSYDALPGQERIDAAGGIDTISFNFRLVDARVSYEGNKVIIDGPSGSHTVLTGFEIFKFTDGTVNNNDGSPLIDDLFYYATYHDVWTAHADADSHFNSVGWKEGRDPSAFFSTVIYLSANADVKASGLNPLTHFDLNGWKEGRVPSLTFDPKAYLAANPDVAAAGVDPLLHYLGSGYQEGRQPIAPTELIAPANGFDYVYYLNHNPDVAAAHVDPFQHFQTVGWKEGRNPNALFDVNGYLNTYTDIKNAGINPLDHYNQFGWKEGRDPSVGFDTTSYLSAYTDVHSNPLVHFLTYGIHEGRSPFADGIWG